MPGWNPNNPNIVGCEQTDLSIPAETISSLIAGPGPTLAGSQTFNPPIRTCLRQTVRSTTAETIDLLRTAFAVTPGAHYLAEVFEDGDEIPSGVTTVEYVPTSMTGGISGTVADVDELHSSPNFSNSVNLGSTGTTTAQFRFSGASGVPAGARILDVKVLGYEGHIIDPYYGCRFTATVGITDGAQIVGTDFQSGTGAPKAFSVSLGEIDPFTGLPWDRDDLVDYLTTSGYIRFTGGPSACFITQRYLYQISIQVTYCTENRVAWGSLVPFGSSAIETREIPLYDSSGAGWSKASATTYSVLVRPSPNSFSSAVAAYGVNTGTPNGSITYAYITGEFPPDYPDYAIVPTSFDTRGAITGTAGSGPASPSTIGLDLYLTGAAETSVDSPIYGSCLMLPVFDGTTVEQEITADANEEYLYLIAVLYIFDGDEPTEDLTVNVRRRSDDALFGTGTVTAFSMLDADRLSGVSDWRRVVVALGSTSPLVSSTQYYIEFESTSPASRPWIVQAVSGTRQSATPAGSGDATFGGTTDVATFDAVDYPTWDVPVAFVIGPDTPEGLDATAGYETVDDTGLDCGPICVPYATVEWTSTALGGEFLYYEIARRDDRDLGWQTVALVDVESVDEWTDYEIRAGGEIVTEYRIRVFRDDLISSEWSSAVSVTVNACGRGYVFSSNWSTARFAYPDVYGRLPTRDYEWASTLVERRVYGRDGVVGFRPTERELVRFERRLMTAAILAPDRGPGPEAFDAFRSFLLDPDLPYVTVRDGDGNRFYALVVAPQAEVPRLGSATFHSIDVEIIEATETSAIPTVSA